MAYLVELKRQCTEERCTRTATHEVRNRYNERIRECCLDHARRLVARLAESEERAP